MSTWYYKYSVSNTEKLMNYFSPRFFMGFLFFICLRQSDGLTIEHYLTLKLKLLYSWFHLIVMVPIVHHPPSQTDFKSTMMVVFVLLWRASVSWRVTQTRACCRWRCLPRKKANVLALIALCFGRLRSFHLPFRLLVLDKDGLQAVFSPWAIFYSFGM